MQYNTRNKKLIWNYLNENGDKWISVDELCYVIGDVVGKSSIYRILSELTEIGAVLKEYSENKKSYIYKADNRNCHEHFHLKCTDCGRFVHIEDKKTEEILSLIATKNEFAIDKGKTILYGLCENCQHKGGK